MAKRQKPSSPVVLIEEYSTAQEIAELQLNILRDRARNGILSYEDAKIYDLMVKNLKIAKEDSSIEMPPEAPKALVDSETADLLKLAQASMADKMSEALNIVEDAPDGESKDPSSSN